MYFGNRITRFYYECFGSPDSFRRIGYKELGFQLAGSLFFLNHEARNGIFREKGFFGFGNVVILKTEYIPILQNRNRDEEKIQ